MANPSSLYAEDENARQTLANGTVLKWTKQLQNIHALNGETDLSIAYTNWANEPMMTHANRGFHQWQGGCVSGGDLGTNQSPSYSYQHATGIKQLESGQPRIDSLQSHVVLSNGGGYYVWGYNPESSTRISGANGDQRRYLLDMDINKMIFGCTITVVDKSFFDNVDFASNPENMPAPAEHNITLKELYTHPELYYCTGSINWNNTYVYGENTSDNWRSAAIRPSIILTGESIGEFQGADDSIFGHFTSNGSFSYDSRDPNAHASFGGGGSSNTLYNRMNAGYFMGCKNEIDMTPTDTFDSAGGMSTAIALDKWGNTNFSHFAYCNGQIFDYGDSVIWCVWGCRVVNNTNTGSIYRDYSFGTKRYIKADKMLKYIASFGLYFASETFDPDSVSLTPETLGDDSRIMLGEMAADGTTTGRWITDIDSYHGPNKDGKTSNPDYNPSGGGGGGGTPGEWDDMPGAGSSIGALAGARCYICSKTDITNLKNWMSKTEADGGAPDGYDVLSSLISVMAFPINMTPASSGPATAISFTGLRTATDNQLVNIASALLSIANSVGATPKTEVKTFTSTATALPSAGNPFTIDLGTCTCPTFYSSDFPFADYDASVELYLPFIGTMSLDTQTVMGNNLHAYMSVDPITGAIYSWCECTKNGSRVVVASGSGAIGVNTPVTANQVGMAMAQIKNNAAQGRNSFIQSAATIAMGAITGVDKNMSSVLMKHITSGNKNVAVAGTRDYADALSVGAQQASMMALPNAIGANLNTGRANRQITQANHNSVSGSAGGSTADWSCSYTPYLKIITPDVHRAGEQYEHTYGIPTILSGTLSTFKGLTFCANPDVSSISTATDQEKQQIFALLSGGVYV